MELFVPGRLCLLGEHSDWAGSWRATHPAIHPGSCLVAGTREGLRAEVRALDEERFVMSAPGPEGPLRLDLPFDELETSVRQRGFFSYAAGVAAELREGHRSLGGIEIRVTSMDLPMKKGLSSSAAACVLVARAFGRVHGLELTAEKEMDLAYRGERRAGSRCGRMDQVCALGPRLSRLGFDGDELSIELLSVGAPIHLLLVDLCSAKDTRRILEDLQACFPDTPGPLAEGLRAALGPRNAELVGAGAGLVETGDVRGLGELMNEVQALFDEQVAPASPELESPRLHAVLGSRAARELAWGGKGVGSQGDGSAQLVARGPEEAEQLTRVLEGDFGVRCLPLVLGGPGPTEGEGRESESALR